MMSLTTMSDNSSSSQQSPRVNYDQRLQTARALDWRFLLPTLCIDRVLVAIDTDTALSATLTTFCQDVVTWDSRSDIDSAFPLVVCDSLESSLICRMATHVAPGGTLVILPHSLPSGRRNAKWRGIPLRRQRQQLNEALTKAGRFTTTAWWHSPDRAQCKTIVSLEDPGAVERYLRSHWPGPCASVVARVARSFICAGRMVCDVTWLANRASG